MQCLHCGKKLSLLRKLSDGRFCSDAHREEYERLEGDIALARLLGARGERGAAPKDKPARGKAAAHGAAPPLAPLLPESLRAANWRRVASPPLRLLAVGFAQSVPESCLRPALRGFPQGPPAELDQPVSQPCRAPLAPAPCPSFGMELADGGAGVVLASARPSTESLERPPAMAGLAELPLPPASAACFCACRPEPILMRRKLVVIVPKPHRRLTQAGFAAAGPVKREARPAAAGSPLPLLDPSGLLPLWAHAAPAAPSPPEHFGLPNLQPSAAAAPDGLPIPTEPPLCSRLKPVHRCEPLAGPLPPASAAAEPASAAPCLLLPASRLRMAVPAFQMAAPCQTAALPSPLYGETPFRPVRPGWQPAASPPCMPAPGVGLRCTTGAWPAAAGLLPMGAPAVSRELSLARLLPEPLGAPAAGALFPGHQPVPAPRALRLSWRQAPIGEPVSPLPSPRPALAAQPQPDWTTLRETIPGSRLELIPPEPSAVPDAACNPDLAALEAAVSRAGAAPTPERPAGGPAPRLPGNWQDAPISAPRAEAADFGDDIAPPRPARRVPEMPIRPVAPALTGQAPALPSTAAASWASLDDPRPMIPRLRLELDHADGSGPRKRGEPARAARQRRSGSSARRMGGRRFWSHAPSDLKWIAVVLPLLLIVVVYSFRTKTPNHPPEGGEMSATATAPAAPAPQEGRLNALQRMILRRAAVRLFDDFRGGLGSWEGREGWAKTWRYGDATFIEPGDLALLTPSLSMTDYTLTFLGQIERRSLNWVFRARDLANYYSMRIVITRGGPLPEAAVVRSVVINGKEQEVRTMPIPFPVRADTLYLVRMEVRGQDFTTYIQNQVVDHFSDSRLKRGGIGFYSPKGDRALLRWVEVSHQYDYLGRLCALLSPYGVQNFASN